MAKTIQEEPVETRVVSVAEEPKLHHELFAADEVVQEEVILVNSTPPVSVEPSIHRETTITASVAETEATIPTEAEESEKPAQVDENLINLTTDQHLDSVIDQQGTLPVKEEVTVEQRRPLKSEPELKQELTVIDGSREAVDKERQLVPDTTVCPSVVQLASNQPQLSDSDLPTSSQQVDITEDSKEDIVEAEQSLVSVMYNSKVECEKSLPSVSVKEDGDVSGSDVSEDVITPSSSISESEQAKSLPKGIFNDPDNDIIEDAPEVLDGKTIPRVLVPSDMWEEVVEKDTWRETFNVPASMGGVLIGRFGKNVRELKSQWNAEFSLNMCPGRQDTLLLKLSCPIENKENVMHWISSRFKMRPSQTTIGNPNQLRVSSHFLLVPSCSFVCKWMF